MRDIRWSGYRIMQEVLKLKELGLIQDRSEPPERFSYVSLRPVLCMDPFAVRYVWTPEEVFGDVGVIDRAYSPDGSLDHARLIELTTYGPCRSCKQCQERKLKSLVWDIRHCIGRHRHNYFATLTFGKQFRLKFSSDDTPTAHNEAVRALGNFFEFLRHHVRAKTFWVQESHKDGFPHFHVVFSCNDETDIPTLTKQWWQRYGISNVKSIPSGEDGRKVANYMAKYMFKNGVPRWGRSHGYSAAKSEHEAE